MDYENVLFREFENFDTSNFRVSLDPALIFICGGPVDIKAANPLSVRQRIIQSYYDKKLDANGCGLVQAEDFKDYLNGYQDLFVFEKDIASISNLIIVCLESPGSLVELGLFCMDNSSVSKLVVVVPENEVKNEDSFIYLGPLKYLISKDKSSVLIYPWADSAFYDYDHIEPLMSDINSKLCLIKGTKSFDRNNSGHLAYLIFEIIKITEHALLEDIQWALLAMDIDLQEKDVKRFLYLLNNLGKISSIHYSSVRYYYCKSIDEKRISFGARRDGLKKDLREVKLSIRQSFVRSSDEQSKKRQYVLRQILETRK